MAIRVLFLDDMAERHLSFETQANAHGLTPYWPVETGEHAIEQLKSSERFDVVFLDHDLASDQYIEHVSGILAPRTGMEMSGTEVAEAIAALPKEKRPGVAIIHSWNRYGAARMARILSDAGIRVLQMPFDDGLLAATSRWWSKAT